MTGYRRWEISSSSGALLILRAYVHGSCFACSRDSLAMTRVCVTGIPMACVAHARSRVFVSVYDPRYLDHFAVLLVDWDMDAQTGWPLPLDQPGMMGWGVSAAEEPLGRSAFYMSSI
jgi:hypothetical protein